MENNVNNANTGGVFAEFINMFKNYANFTDRTTVKGYWMAFLWSFIGLVVLGWIPVLGWLVSLGMMIPMLAIQVRRLRDAGKHWAWIFISLVPLAGFIILIVFLCKESVPDDGVPVV